MSDMESLAREYFEAEHLGCGSGCIGGLGFIGTLTVVAFLVPESSGVSGVGMITTTVGLIISLLAGIWLGRHRHARSRSAFVRKRMAAYADGDAMLLQQVQDYAIKHFRQLVEEHRARTMGPDSEWARARAPLTEAVDEADRSVAYWRERLASDPDNDAAARQYRIVKGLEEKLRSALSKVDERADLLTKFYNDCEAKLAVMDRCKQDIVETAKVEELSSKAEVVVAQAEGSIQALAHAFVDEAQRIGRVLGETAGAHYKMLAGEAPLEDIEYLADKVVECSDGEQAQIKDMRRRLAE